MTTPERLRRRQRRESFFIAVLALALTCGWFYFRAEDLQQDRCITEFIENQQQTSKIRSRLVERESLATRAIIIGVFTVDTREQVQQEFRDYSAALKEIDRARDANPIEKFPEDLCR